MEGLDRFLCRMLQKPASIRETEPNVCLHSFRDALKSINPKPLNPKPGLDSFYPRESSG